MLQLLLGNLGSKLGNVFFQHLVTLVVVRAKSQRDGSERNWPFMVANRVMAHNRNINNVAFMSFCREKRKEDLERQGGREREREKKRERKREREKKREGRWKSIKCARIIFAFCLESRNTLKQHLWCFSSSSFKIVSKSFRMKDEVASAKRPYNYLPTYLRTYGRTL